MKKVCLSLFILLVLALLLPISTSGRSFYNGISGAMFCDSAEGCRHEIGHRMDDDQRYPSRSKEFGTAVLLYAYANIKYTDALEPFSAAILAQDGMLRYSDDFTLIGVERFSSPQEELYANIYQLAGGNIDRLPEIFRPFFSRDAKYIELYDCLMASELKLCGISLHLEDED
jgi:hypothetical protein